VEWPWVSMGEGTREMLRRWTPRNVTMKPMRRETVFVPSVVLNPWKRIREATMVADEKPT
jgi:hypothetical protein